MKALIAAAAVIALAAPATATGNYLHQRTALRAAHRYMHNDLTHGFHGTNYRLVRCWRVSHTFVACHAREYGLVLNHIDHWIIDENVYIHARKTGKVDAHDEWTGR